MIMATCTCMWSQLGTHVPSNLPIYVKGETVEIHHINCQCYCCSGKDKARAKNKLVKTGTVGVYTTSQFNIKQQ